MSDAQWMHVSNSIVRRLISRNRLLRKLRQWMGDAWGGLIDYRNVYYRLAIQRSTGLVTRLQVSDQAGNLAYAPLGFPLNEYFDAHRGVYYWPNYALNRTVVREGAGWRAIETTGSTRDYFLRKGALAFRQVLTLLDGEPYFVVEAQRVFAREVTHCLDESLCFISMCPDAKGRFSLSNGQATLEQPMSKGLLTLSCPTGEALAIYDAGQFGMVVYTASCSPPPESVRWALPRTGEYCEFEIVWTDRKAARGKSNEFAKCYVLPCARECLAEIRRASFESNATPKATFNRVVGICKRNHSSWSC